MEICLTKCGDIQGNGTVSVERRSEKMLGERAVTQQKCLSVCPSSFFCLPSRLFDRFTVSVGLCFLVVFLELHEKY